MSQQTEQPIPPQTQKGAEPDSPVKLGKRGWKEALGSTVNEFKDDRGTLTAAGMAFYWFLAVFPALVALVGLLGLVNAGPDVIDSVTRAIRSALPGDAARVLTDAVGSVQEQSQGSSFVAAIVGIALALWSASSGMAAMQVALDIAYDVPKDRKFVKKRLVAFLLMVVFLVFGGVASALLVFGAPLGDALRDNLPFGSAFVVLWTLLRFALGIGVLTAMFACFYYLAPYRETPRWVWVSPGGLLGMGIWLAASIGFSLYVSTFGSYAETYGSLAGVVVLLLWLYLSAIAVVLGGELNAELERESAEQKGQVAEDHSDRESERQEPDPGLVRAEAPPASSPLPTASNGTRPRGSDIEGWRQRMRQLREQSSR